VADGCAVAVATRRQRDSGKQQQAATRALLAAQAHKVQRVQCATTSHSNTLTQRVVEKRRRVIADIQSRGVGALTTPEQLQREPC
jgi:hypothetical protein